MCKVLLTLLKLPQLCFPLPRSPHGGFYFNDNSLFEPQHCLRSHRHYPKRANSNTDVIIFLLLLSLPFSVLLVSNLVPRHGTVTFELFEADEVPKIFSLCNCPRSQGCVKQNVTVAGMPPKGPPPVCLCMRGEAASIMQSRPGMRVRGQGDDPAIHGF